MSRSAKVISVTKAKSIVNDAMKESSRVCEHHSENSKAIKILLKELKINIIKEIDENVM